MRFLFPADQLLDILAIHRVAGFNLPGQLHFDGGPLELLPGFTFLPLALVYLPLVDRKPGQVEMGPPILGVHLVGGLELLAGLLVLPLAIMDDAQVAPENGVIGLVRRLQGPEQDQFQPDPEAIRRAITPKTKAIIVNSPSNPTGAVMERARLQAIGQLAKEHGLLIVSDEMYDALVYPPAQHVSIIQTDPSLAERTIIVGGVSKTYSMTGWRIGWAVGPKPWIELMSNLQSHSTSNATSISQHAALAALTGPQDAVTAMREEFRKRRDRLVAGLNALPGLRCAVPGGAFYAWCNVSALGQPAEKTAAAWLEDALVAVVPGDPGFGDSHYVRFSFATSMQTIDQALERLGAWCQKRLAARAA